VALTDRLPGREQAADPAPAAHDDDIQRPVVGHHGQLRSDREAGPAEVRHEDLERLDPRAAAVDLEFVPDIARAAALPDEVRDVRQPTPAELLAPLRGRHHLGVEADPARHREPPLVAVDVGPAEIDRPARLAEEAGDGTAEILRDLEVGRDEVPGAGRDDAEGDVRGRESLDNAQDRAVATDGHDHLSARLHGPRGALRERALPLHHRRVDGPAGLREPGPNRLDRLRGRPTLPFPADDQRLRQPDARRFGRDPAGGDDAVGLASGGAVPTDGARHGETFGLTRNAYATTSSHAAPARNPPRTSVK